MPENGHFCFTGGGFLYPIAQSLFSEGNFDVKKRLLAGTALTGFVFIAMSGTSAFASCNNHAPSSNQTVTCSATGGTDNAGINGSGNTNITVTLNPNAAISTAANAIVIGSGNINLGAGSSITSGGSSGIIINATASSSVDMAAGSSIAATTYGIRYTAGSAALGISVAGTLAGGTAALDIGAGTLQFTLYDTASITGDVIAGSGGGDSFILAGTGSGSLDSSEIGVAGQYSGFESFSKTGTGTWTLTNTGSGHVWTISGGTLRGSTAEFSAGTTTVTGTGTLDITSGANLAQTITGTGNVSVTNGNTVLISGTNDYSGATTVNNASTLQINSANSVSNTSGITLDDGTLQTTATLSLDRDFTLGAGNGTLLVDPSQTATLSGSIGGAGALIKTGTGNLILSGTNNYSGGTTISAGTLTASSLGALGSGDITDNAALTISGGGTFAGNITGTGSLVKTGTGNLALSGTNNYSGGTTISAGTLTASSLGALGSGDITDNAALTISGGGTFAGNITGTGAVTINGGTTAALSGTNDYSGATTVNNASTLQIASALTNTSGITLDDGTLQTTATLSLDRDFTLGAGNGTLLVDPGQTATLSGSIGGAGALIKTGTGNLILSGTNNYSGGTTISAGTLTASSLGALGSGDITDNAALTISGGGTFAGNITGTGSLDVTIGGGGTLTLTGTTDYTGATTVGGSTILALNSTNALTGTSHITFTNAAADFTSAMNGQTFDRDITIAGTQDTINIDSGTTVTLSGTIDGAGQFVKAGAGHLILTGTKTYAGGTDVTNGLLSVNTTITGATTVGGGGSIGGTGTTGDLTIDNNGTLAPGNSIGTFNVAGNLIFNSNASYDVEADENGNADKTVATGAITINGGTVNANAASGIYRPVTTYTILQGASVTGAFDNVTDNLAFLDPSLVYNPDSVQLVLTRNNNPFESAATNGQQAGIAAAVEGLDLGNDLYDAVVVLPVQDARHAFDALSGGQTAAVSGALGAGMSRLRGVLGYHLANLTLMGSSGSVASAAPAADDADPGSYVAAYLEPSDGHDTTGRNIWIQGIGSFGATTDRGTTPSSARHSAGAIAGIDMPFEDDGYYGIYAGWESGGVKTNALHSSSNIDSYHLGAYATHSLPHGLNLAGGLSAAWHDISSRRVIEFTGWNTRATGDTNGQTYMAFAELSRDYDVGGDIAFAPFADVSVIHNRIAGFAETGGGTANLTVQDTHATTPSHTLGLRLGHLGGAGAARYKIGAKLGWMHNYGALADKTTQRFSTGTVSFSDLGPARDRDAAVLGLDFNVYMDAALTAYLGYDGTYSTNSRDTSLSAGVKIRF